MKRKILSGSLLLLSAGFGSAATISLFSQGNIADNSVVDLTAEGTSAWRLWNTTTNGNSKNGSTAISDITFNAGTSSVTYASNEAVAILYKWTDGTAGGLGGGVSNTDMAGYNPNDPRMTSATGSTELDVSGASLSLTILGKITEQTVTIYGYKRLVGEQITATLAGATTVVSGAGSAPGVNGDRFKQVFKFTADNDGDLMTLTLRGVNSETSTTQERVGFGAVTVANIPEPSVALLGTLGLLGLLRRRRA